jgi:uncharacterized DUF497 family protein
MLKWYGFATIMDEEFEYDPVKSAANREKHGIDFAEAQELWTVSGWEQPSPFLNELRIQRTAPIQGRLWTAVFTLRGRRIRLISVRRARKDEVETYERSVAENPGTDPES